MKKISGRALSVLLLAFLIILGLFFYVWRYVEHGQDWALYFSSANSKSSGKVLDRNGVMLAGFSSDEKLFAEDALTRKSCYHVTGDYWGRTGSGLLRSIQSGVYDFSVLTGTTTVKDRTCVLTLDSSLNNLAYREMGERKGAVLLCNYKTGEMLCLVSCPSVDPADEDAEVPEGAYINRCLSASFVPGSVFKLITAAAAIENIDDIDDWSFYCDGESDIAGVKIKCSGTHYSQTFEQALANSCNCAFAQIAVMLGQDTMVKYVKQYGFLDSHRLEGIPTAKGSYPQEFVGDPELAWSGIGQSTVLVCPYSLLRYVSAIANGGVLCEPYLIEDGEPSEKSQLME